MTVLPPELREALETVGRGIAEPHRANNRHEYQEAKRALALIEQRFIDYEQMFEDARADFQKLQMKLWCKERGIGRNG